MPILYYFSNYKLITMFGISGPSQGHIDWISALTLCQSSRWYVVSGSRDGVIKVWK
jgi:WD40 repeat protein